MTKEPIKREDLLKSEQGQAPKTGEATPGWHHGLTEEQIAKIENARYDDSEGVPPPVSTPVEEPADAKAKAKADKENEAEAEKKRGVKHG